MRRKDEILYNAVGLRIRQIRKDKGLSQEKLSKLVPMSANYLRKMESANINANPSLAILYDVAHALEVELADLFVNIGEFYDELNK